MDIKVDVTPELLNAFRTIVKEELAVKADQLTRSPKALNRFEAAGVLGISLPTLDNFLKSGSIKFHKAGRRVFILENSINEFLDSFKSKTDH